MKIAKRAGAKCDHHKMCCSGSSDAGFKMGEVSEVIAIGSSAEKLEGASRVSVQGVKSLVSNFACLCREFDFYKVKKNIIFFKKKREILLHF
jgi:hypothetical protein